MASTSSPDVGPGRGRRVALATCRDLPAREQDDRHLTEALDAEGIGWEWVNWDDPDADWRSFDACLVRTTWDYTSRHAEFLNWIQRVAGCTQLFNPPEILRWSCDKLYLFELERAAVPIVPTVLLERGGRPDLPELLGRTGWERAFLKPVIGATSRETLRFDVTRAGLERATNHVERLLPAEDLLLQPYLAGVEKDGEFSLFYLDGQLTHGVQKLPRPGDYRSQDDFGAEDRSWEPTAAQIDVAQKALGCIEGDWLYARVDLLSGDAGEPLLIELELVEPSLFFRRAPRAAATLVQGLARRLG